MNARLEFVDTNILLYAVDKADRKKHEAARALLHRLWEAQSGCLSVQVLQEFYVNATRKVSVPLASSVAAQTVADYGQWLVHTPGVEDVLASIAVQTTHQVSLWDALILNSASFLGASVVWSEDLNDGQLIGGVEIRSPFKAAA